MKFFRPRRTFWRRSLRQKLAAERPHPILAFVKEWGAALTVLIAVLYTFPFDAIPRIITWRERNVVAARESLSLLAELTERKILALKKIKDDNDANETQFLTNTFNIRIYNILTTNREQFKNAMPDLTASELYSLASNYSLTGLVGDAIPFYEKSLEKSRNTDIPAYVAASRELAVTYTYNSSYRSPDDSIKNYYNALAEIVKKENHLDPSLYAVDLSELAITELRDVDWKCGVEAREIANEAFEKLILLNPQMQGAKAYFANTLGAIKQKPGQATLGCKTPIPVMYEY